MDSYLTAFLFCSSLSFSGARSRPSYKLKATLDNFWVAIVSGLKHNQTLNDTNGQVHIDARKLDTRKVCSCTFFFVSNDAYDPFNGLTCIMHSKT